MAEAYMAWSLNQRGAGGKGFFDLDEQCAQEEQQKKCDGMDTKLLSVLILDVFCTEKTSITVGPADHYLTSALIRHGLILCSPISPKVAITVHTLDLYHTAHQHCPYILIQAYVKSLCDIHEVPFHNHRLQQFSIVLNIYLQVLGFVSNLVHQALQHDQPDWQLKHGCPTCYFEHNDEMEVYVTLTKFLLNNYKQALDLLSNGHTTLEQLMRKLGVSDPMTFRVWLDEEHVYLKSLLCEPVEEMLQMEYWQWLVNLDRSRKNFESILSTWTIVTANNPAPIWSDGSATRKAETMHRHAQDNYEKDLKAVQELEGWLGITCHWVPEDEEWQAAAHLVANQKYQWVLDNIEHLVVSQIFELSKMNQSGTGYKLHKHIGKALQTCSAAIQAALLQYNTAAKALGH
ncbi:hypothetical protein EDC04DRAFT_2911220 [Pisolithus marmoratus]|nr:hypothetical protein EDC04DRAFT_2911220 [Pisolithus marmoratus]